MLNPGDVGLMIRIVISEPRYARLSWNGLSALLAELHTVARGFFPKEETEHRIQLEVVTPGMSLNLPDVQVEVRAFSYLAAWMAEQPARDMLAMITGHRVFQGESMKMACLLLFREGESTLQFRAEFPAQECGEKPWLVVKTTHTNHDPA